MCNAHVSIAPDLISPPIRCGMEKAINI